MMLMTAPVGLGNHGVDGFSGCLQHTLEHQLGKAAKGQAAAYGEILLSVENNFFNIRLAAEKRFREKQTDDKEQQIAEQYQKNSVFRNLVDFVEIPLSE